MKFFVQNRLFATRRSAIITVWRKETITKVKFCVRKRARELYLLKTELHISFSDPGQSNKTLETSISASAIIFKMLTTIYSSFFWRFLLKGSRN